MHQSHDLFGEIPVTWPEVYAWIEAVAGISRDSYRAAHYITAWSVVDKVARAKLEGTFDAIVEPHQAPDLPVQLAHLYRWQ